MTGDDVLSIIKKHGGYITGSHIVYTSGKHGEAYLNKDVIYPHTDDVSAICKSIAEKYKGQGVETVAAPALGGIILSQWTAYHLSKLEGREIFGVYTEKTPEKNQIFTRGYDKFVKGKKVLIVEDITTTGGSVLKVVNSVKNAGGEIIGVCVLVNRNPAVDTKMMGAPFTALATVNFQAFEEKNCPLCAKNVPINTAVGHGRQFLSAKSKA